MGKTLLYPIIGVLHLSTTQIAAQHSAVIHREHLIIESLAAVRNMCLVPENRDMNLICICQSYSWELLPMPIDYGPTH